MELMMMMINTADNICLLVGVAIPSNRILIQKESENKSSSSSIPVQKFNF
jgi:hypothetical protein